MNGTLWHLAFDLMMYCSMPLFLPLSLEQPNCFYCKPTGCLCAATPLAYAHNDVEPQERQNKHKRVQDILRCFL